MAGIAGMTGPEQEAGLAERMLQCLEHRGEDDVRVYQVGSFRGGVRSARLSAARGDGFATDENITVLFDGEIYNDRPDGSADADVAMALYKQHGRTFAGRLEGVFACAVFDAARQELILARDAVGVRPLYWGRTKGGNLCFASELKALVGIADQVEELLPGTTFSSASGIAGYLPRVPDVAVPSGFDEAKAQLRRLLMRAVQRRLADGAVGACLLSGGLDSSIMACAAYDLGVRLPLVTVGIEGAPDLANAAAVAEHLGAEHHVLLYDAEQIRQAVPRAVSALESFDEDCVSGTVSNLFASAKARQLTNCILSGEGGDELFGGYHLLKDLPTQAGRLRMMQRLIEVAYNTALQRLDRAMMGSGIHYRTPFIDTHVVAFALQLPVAWKIHDRPDAEPIEKYILREAFRDLLPEPIYKRSKLRFSAGTGTDGLMDRLAAGAPAASDFGDATRRTPAGYTLSSAKELWYYRLFTERFPGEHFEKLVGRWDPGK